MSDLSAGKVNVEPTGQRIWQPERLVHFFRTAPTDGRTIELERKGDSTRDLEWGRVGMVGGIEAVLAALNAAGVRYLVVGGVAVVLHGHLRTTADLDLVVQLEPTNVLRAIQALSELGYRPSAPVPAAHLADPVMREAWIREKGLTVFGLWSDRFPGLAVDLFVSEPFDFDEAYERAVQVRLDTTTATVVSLADLLLLKRAAGRPLDQSDVEALREIGEEESR